MHARDERALFFVRERRKLCQRLLVVHQRHAQPDRDGRLRAYFVQRFHLPLCPVSERVLPNHSMAQMEK